MCAFGDYDNSLLFARCTMLVNIRSKNRKTHQGVTSNTDLLDDITHFIFPSACRRAFGNEQESPRRYCPNKVIISMDTFVRNGEPTSRLTAASNASHPQCLPIAQMHGSDQS